MTKERREEAEATAGGLCDVVEITVYDYHSFDSRSTTASSPPTTIKNKVHGWAIRLYQSAAALIGYSHSLVWNSVDGFVLQFHTSPATDFIYYLYYYLLECLSTTSILDPAVYLFGNVFVRIVLFFICGEVLELEKYRWHYR